MLLEQLLSLKLFLHTKLLTYFMSLVSLYTLWKDKKNLWFFKGYRKRSLAWNQLIKYESKQISASNFHHICCYRTGMRVIYHLSSHVAKFTYMGTTGFSSHDVSVKINENEHSPLLFVKFLGTMKREHWEKMGWAYSTVFVLFVLL